jgi:hypothetical protein
MQLLARNSHFRIRIANAMAFVQEHHGPGQKRHLCTTAADLVVGNDDGAGSSCPANFVQFFYVFGGRRRLDNDALELGHPLGELPHPLPGERCGAHDERGASTAAVPATRERVCAWVGGEGGGGGQVGL